MRRFRMLAALVAGIAWLAVPVEAWAQNRDKAWEVFPFLGHISLSQPGFGDSLEVRPGVPVPPAPPNPGQSTLTLDQSEIDDDLSFGLRFGFHWSKRHMIEFAFAGAATDARGTATNTVLDNGTGNPVSTTSVSESLSVDIMFGEVNYVYNFFLQRRDKIVAYVTGGATVVITSVFGLTAEPDLRDIFDEYVGETNDVGYNVGGGVRFFGSEKVGFRIDLRKIRYSPDNRIDQDILQLSMGVSLVLGGT